MAIASGKVGSYAVATVDFDSWMNEPFVPSNSKTRKGKNVVQEVIHTIFAECAEVTDDFFWKDKFTNASKGSFPPKFYYRNNTLFYRRGSKPPQLLMPDNPIDASLACIDFFKLYGLMLSPTDEKRSADLQNNINHNILSQNELIVWESANKRVQDSLISHYVVDVQREKRLTNLEKEQLRETILVAILCKKLSTKDDKGGRSKAGMIKKGKGRAAKSKETTDDLSKEGIICLANNRISAVNGVIWDENKRKFYIDAMNNSFSTFTDELQSIIDDNDIGILTKTPQDSTKLTMITQIDRARVQKDTMPHFIYKWNKYMETLDKKEQIKHKKQQKVVIVHDDTTVLENYEGDTGTDVGADSHATTPTSDDVYPNTGDVDTDLSSGDEFEDIGDMLGMGDDDNDDVEDMYEDD